MIADALLKATPILFCAMAFLLARKGGVVNVGAEGQFLAGALAATMWATRVPGPALLTSIGSLAAGAAAGAAWAALPAWLREKRGVLDALSTILLNFVAAGLLAVAVHSFAQEQSRRFPQSDPVSMAARLPIVWPGTRLHAGFAIAVAVAVGIGLFLRRTCAGFRLRATGAGPEAAQFAGIRTTRTRAAAFLAAGAVAGLGGAAELLGTTGRLFESFSAGAGYVGLAAAVVGGMSAERTVAASIAFGALSSAGALLQRRTGVSSVLVLAVEGTVLLIAVGLPRRRARA
jgi:general nucleoside transport system permease protein